MIARHNEIVRDKSWNAGYTDFVRNMPWRPNYWRAELGQLYDGDYWMGWEDAKFETIYSHERISS